MPDYSLEELNDMLRAIDMMVRIGDLITGDNVADFEIKPVFTLIPGQVPSMRIPSLRMPLGTRGPHDPNGVVIDRTQSSADLRDLDKSVSALWAEVVEINKKIADARRQDHKDFDHRMLGSEIALIALDERLDSLVSQPEPVISEHPAETSSSLVSGGDVLPDSSQDVGQVQIPEPLPSTPDIAAEASLPADPVQSSIGGQVTETPSYFAGRAWSESEDWAIIERIASARAQDARGAVAIAVAELSELLARTAKAVTLRSSRHLKERIEIRAAQLRAEAGIAGHHTPDAPSEAPEGQAVTAAEIELEKAQAVTADEPKAQPANEPASTPAAPAAPQSEFCPDPLIAHLTSPRTRYRKGQPDWTYAEDAELMDMVLNNTPAAIIGDELGLQPHEVTARFDQLTGYERETKTRRFNRTSVSEALTELAVRAAHQPAA